MDAAKAAECASDQGHFWETHEGLFEAGGSGGLTSDSIRTVATSVGLDMMRFDDCLSTVAERIEKDIEEARRLDLRATPAFLFGTTPDDGTVAIRARINGAQPLNVFASAINELKTP